MNEFKLEIKPAAQKLNDILRSENSAILDMLSERGLAISFPWSGILGQSAEAKGKKINATIGIAVLDDGTPMRLPSVMEQIGKIGETPADALTYAPSQGKPELRKVWKEMIRKKNPSLGNALISTPIVTIALTHGAVVAGYLFANPGDEIIVADKFWGNYNLMFENNFGAKLKKINTFKGNGMDLEALKEAVNAPGDKKIIVFNFPNNPAGYTPTDGEAHAIAKMLHEAADRGKKIVAIFDDAYFGLVYKPGVFRESVFALCANLHQNILAVKLDGGTKEDYVWGFRVGFITFAYKGMQASGDVKTPRGAEVLEDKAAGAVRGTVSNAPQISQSILVKAFTSPTYGEEKRKMFEILKARVEEVDRILAENEGRYREVFRPLPYNSGYFMCVQVDRGIDAEKVRKMLLDKYSTGVINVGDNLLRVAFSATPKKDIAALFENIFKACKNVKAGA
ncbi:Histidinol-phosphate aminotransferase [Candidatus Gugararchaeum adminiculabundum]|nr:Histidinol-phosphate aminotransferase [Candidatus Gugararchaeum adminiculabundum]